MISQNIKRGKGKYLKDLLTLLSFNASEKL